MTEQNQFNEIAAQEFVIPLFKNFCKEYNLSENFDSLSQKEREKVMELFNKKVSKYHLFKDHVIELNLAFSSGDIDFKSFTIDEFVHKAGKFEEATELYISRKELESKTWIVITAILLVCVVIVWMV